MSGSSDAGREDRDQLTNYGQGIGWLFAGVFFLVCAWYLTPLPTTEAFDITLYLERGADTLFYVFTSVCWLLSMGLFGRGPREHPGLGRFLKSLFGGGEEGWRYIFLTTFAVGLSTLLYGATLLIPEDPILYGVLEWVKGILMLFVLVTSFFAVVLLAHAIDAFFIKPILRASSSDQETFVAYVDRFRKSTIIVVPILIALAALIVELWK